MSKNLYEISPKDFDGGTDARDDEVLWVSARTREAVVAEYPDSKVQRLPCMPGHKSLIDRELAV